MRDGQLEWAGFVLMDLVTVEFGKARYDYTVAATDGLARLKKIDYNPKGIEDFDTYLNHLYRIFTEMPLARYFGPGQTFLSVHSTIHPDVLTPDMDTPQLDNIRIGVKALRTVNDKGEIKYRTFYDVLEELLRMIGARLTFARGQYWLIEAVDCTRTVGLVTFHEYDAWNQYLDATRRLGWTNLSTVLATEPGSGGSTALAGGTITYLPPLKAVVATYQHFSRQNLFPGSGLYSFNDRASVPNFGTDQGGGRIAISGSLQVTVLDGAPQFPDPKRTIYARIFMRLRVLDDEGESGVSFSRPSTITEAGYTYGEETWSEDFRNNLCDIVVKVTPPVIDRAVTQSFAFVTPPVPQSGELELIFSRDGIYVDGEYDEFASFDFQADNVFVESLLEGSIEDQYNESEFRADNESEYTNSAVLERIHLFGDGPGDNTFGRIEARVDGEWVRTDGWRRWDNGDYLDDVGTLPHTALLAWMTLGLQRLQRERLDISIKSSDYVPHHLIGAGGQYYICESAEQDALTDTWRGSWRAASFIPPSKPKDPTRTEEVRPRISDTAIGGTTAPKLPIRGTLNPRGQGTGDVNEPGTGELGPKQAGVNTVSGLTVIEADARAEPLDKIRIDKGPDEMPIYRGQRLYLTDPTTGQRKTVRAKYDFAQGVETTPDDPDATPFHEADGTLKFLKQTGGDLAVEDEDGRSVLLPGGAFVQFEPTYVLKAVDRLRKVPFTAVVAGYTQALTEGYLDWFWHPTTLEGHNLSGVRFTFAQISATAKINLKYFDGGAYRYTVATYEGAEADVLLPVQGVIRGGFYRVEVERLDGPPPRGLQLTIDTVRRL